jgi:predicted nucleic acid-binding protein
VKRVVYDTGVLIAADRNERKVWAEHKVRLEAGMPPLVATPALAQASRSPEQAQLRRFLRGCEVVPFKETDAHRAGALLKKSRTRDVVDAAVVVLALEHDASIVSGDEQDLARLLRAAQSKLPIEPI